MSIAIVVHGGAGKLQAERAGVTQDGCKEAALIGWRVLQEGGSSLDAVEAAVRALEDNPQFNAGTGSGLTVEGNIEMDAGMMEGHTLRVGAVAGVELIKNPIVLARKVLESPHVLLAGVGAQRFALENGLSLCTYEELLTERQYRNWQTARGELMRQLGQEERLEAEEEPSIHRLEVYTLDARPERVRSPYQVTGPIDISGMQRAAEHEPHPLPGDEPQPLFEDREEDRHGTVGAVALDQFGTLSAATSTGGIPAKYPGRIGDSPLVGCGFYADELAAISCTGHGEHFMRLLLAKRSADYVTGGATAKEAAEKAVKLMADRTGGTGGLIIVDKQGNIGFSWNTEHMVYAYMNGEMAAPVAGI